MRFAIWANEQRDPGFLVRDELISILRSRGAEFSLQTKDFPSCDLLISLGGDGTFLTTAHLSEARDLPCIGINLGSVGFLTEIDRNKMAEAVDQIMDGNVQEDSRMMLEIEANDEQGSLLSRTEALNDLVISREGSSRIITVDLYINDLFVERIPGDGLIIATPTGSTAYSLAAGGPIVYPDMDLMLITPICPHSLHNRSYLAPADSEIKVCLPDPEASAVANADGKHSVMMSLGSVRVRKAKRRFRLLRLGEEQFYVTLAKKIQQRGMIQ